MRIMKLRRTIYKGIACIGIGLAMMCGGKRLVCAAGTVTEDYEHMELIQNGAVVVPNENYSFEQSDETSMVTYFSDEGEQASEVEKMQQNAQLIRANNAETLKQRKEDCAKVLFDGMMALESQIDVVQFALSSEEFREVISDVVNSNPELFYIRNGYSAGKFYLSGDSGTQIVQYCCNFYENKDTLGNPDRDKIRVLKNQVDAKKREILSNVIVNDMSAVEKALAIHDYIILNTKYDNEAYLKYTEAGSPSGSKSKYFADGDFDIYGTLMNGIAVCQGYSLTYKYLLEAAGIDNIGFASNTDHIWNTVTFAGNSYYVDCTWDDPNWDTLGNVKHNNFLKSESAFHHTVLETDRVCNGKAYDSAFWEDVDSAFWYYRGYYYYMGKNGILYRTKLRTQADIFAEKTTVFNAQAQTSEVWNYDNAGKTALVKSNILYHDRQKIYYYNIKTGEQGTALAPNLEQDVFIYGILYQDGTFSYATRQQAESAGSTTYSNTQQKCVDASLPQQLFDISVESITINGDSQIRLTMEGGTLQGEKTKLSVSILPQNATDKRIGQWTSSNPSIATVDINGTVKAVGPGTAVITAVSYDGLVTGSHTVKVVYNGVIVEKDGNMAYFEDGKRLENCFYKAGNKQYYLDKDGHIVRGWLTINGKRYYFGENGVMLTGLQTVDKKQYMFSENGIMQTGWQTVGGRRYYFNKEGVMLTGWQTISKKKYYFAGNGVMQTGWKTIEKKKYYFNKEGVMLTGWQKLDSKKYYFSSNGVMSTKWKTIKNKKYYFNNNGTMQTGWKTIKKKKYYFNSKGVMQKGFKTIKKKKYYFNSKGVMQKGFKTIKGKRYYFDSKGVMQTGLCKVKGISYYFAKDGHLVS
ncbi:MAG: Ig-like domain-containing protein [Lachnospiraceae bacterium]|nr:Ig-like domain-containing protein [Lachnospiraceae bacterium]